MTLSTWQLIVVAALATIWVVVLGVPLLADLLRWLRSRPPAPRIDRVPVRHNVVESIERAWRERPRPIRSWRAQDLVTKRFQWMLSCGVATTIAMFLAIAFRGVFVPLFLVMLAFSFVTLAVGAFVGGSEDEHVLSQLRARNGAGDSTSETTSETNEAHDKGDLLLPGLLGDAPLTQPDDVPTANPFGSSDGEITIPTLADITEAFRSPDRSGFMFEPLNLDAEEGGFVASEAVAEQLSGAEPVDVPVDPALITELGLDVADRHEPRFSAAPEAGYRQASARARRKKRSKARPIYIESVLDDDENPTKAIND